MRAARRGMLLAAAGFAALLAGGAAWTFRDDGSVKGDCMLSPADVDLSPLDRVSESTWRGVADLRVFFGHQSVGSNIIAGLEDIQQRQPAIRLNIIDTRDPARMTPGVFAQTAIGRNGRPQEKTDDFAKVLDGGMGDRADVALFKLCYVDINEATDFEPLFQRYRETMTRLQREHPNVTIVWCTVPLTTVERGPKSRVKALLGRALWGYQENARREQYNDMLRQAAGAAQPRVPLLDLARIESTLPDGRSASFMMNGRPIACLAECYTHDGGHLNEVGRMIAAREMLLALARIVEERKGAETREGSRTP